MKILILSGSPRRHGNTDLLAEAFAEGAGERHQVELLHVRDLHVAPCIGCNTCFKNAANACPQQDDMPLVYAKLASADMLVIASPVYFYGISAQLKAVIDRLHNPLRDTFHIRQAALLLVGAATLPELFDAILTQYRLCLKFFGMKDAGKVLVRGIKDKGDIAGHDSLKEAYELGHSLQG